MSQCWRRQRRLRRQQQGKWQQQRSVLTTVTYFWQRCGGESSSAAAPADKSSAAGWVGYAAMAAGWSAAMQVFLRCSSVVVVTAMEKLWLLRGVVPKEQVEVLQKIQDSKRHKKESVD